MARVGASALAAVLIATACTPRPTPGDRTSVPTIVVPTEVPNGRVEILLRPSYTLSATTRVDVAVVVARGAITGPVEARVMASGINEGSAPAEVLVRRLAVTPVTISAGQRATASVVWDGHDEKGVRVPADAYVLVFEFESIDRDATRRVTAAATLQMND
jgi:hypothetical protein